MKDKEKEKGEVSRRDFLVGAGAVVVGGAIGAGIAVPLMAGKEGEVTTVTKTVSVPTTVTKTVGDGAAVTVTDTVTTTVGAGETVTKTVASTVTTTVADGGVPPALEPETSVVQNINNTVIYDIKNGKIVRGRPLHYDSMYPDLKPFTFRARGKELTIPMHSAPAPWSFLYRKAIDSPTKLLYPLKRVDWEPGGDPAKRNTQNRGKSKFKRISWDEAATIVASEMKRIADTYGPEAICMHSSSMGERRRGIASNKGTHEEFLDWWTLKEYGRLCSTIYGATSSNCGGAWAGMHSWGFAANGWEKGPAEAFFKDIFDNVEVMWNPADPLCRGWQGGQGNMAGVIWQWFHQELGIKMICVSPTLNRTAGTMCDKWVPVISQTDAALHSAMAYTWIDEGTYDEDYIATHTIGFDKWKAYVMGDEDGIPKTPEWASPLCGVPEWTIKALARQYASKATSKVKRGGGICRGVYGYNQTTITNYLQAMQGWGKPGRHEVDMRQSPPGAAKGPSYGKASINRMITDARDADVGEDAYEAADEVGVRQRVHRVRTADCILNPPVYWWTREEQELKQEYPLPGHSEIHMFWKSGASWHGLGGSNARFKAFKSPKIEFIACQTSFMEEAPYWADIILPVSIFGEKPDIGSATDTYTAMFAPRKCVEPRGEAKSDFGVVCEIAKKLGWFEKLTGGKDAEEIELEKVKQAYDISGWQDKVSWENLLEKGYFVDDCDPDFEANMETEVLPSTAFYNDPDANPLGTPSGLFEFESVFLKEHFPDDIERPPTAKYVRGGATSSFPEEGYWMDEDRFISQRANDYPLVQFSNVPEFAEHSMHGYIPWIRELTKYIGWDGYAYERIMVHPTTAAERGIAEGDIVRVYNQRGSILAGAYVTERIIPGVLEIDKARGIDYIVTDEVDRGGSPNMLSPGDIGQSYRCSLSMVQNGYLVQLEKVTGDQMDEWRKNNPAAFARDYDPAYGPLFSGWVEGGK